jgi:hypothetical protein
MQKMPGAFHAELAMKAGQKEIERNQTTAQKK